LGGGGEGGGGAQKTSGAVMPEGTPNYMPAEVVRHRHYSDKSDVWALGVTILECLTGKLYTYMYVYILNIRTRVWALGVMILECVTGTLGHAYSNPNTTLFRVGLGASPEVPAWLSQEARDIVGACLQPNPLDRPNAAALLAHPFLAYTGRGSGGMRRAEERYVKYTCVSSVVVFSYIYVFFDVLVLVSSPCHAATNMDCSPSQIQIYGPRRATAMYVSFDMFVWTGSYRSLF